MKKTKRFLALTLVFTLLLSLMTAFPASAATADAITNLNTGAMYDSDELATAVSEADPNDTLELVGGITYELAEWLIIEKPLTIQGEGSGAGLPTIKPADTWQAKNDSSDNLITFFNTSDVKLENLKIEGSLRNGITFQDATNIVINNITIANSAAAAIIINGAEVEIGNLTTSNNAWGAINVDDQGSPSLKLTGTLNISEEKAIWTEIQGGFNNSNFDFGTVIPSGTYFEATGKNDTVLSFTQPPINNGSKWYWYDALADAVADAQPGDTIILSAGGTFVLTETLTIDKELTIKGETGGTQPIIWADDHWDGSLPSAKLNLVNILSDNVHLENLCFQNAKGNGVHVYESVGVTIKDITINDNAKAALLVNGSEVEVGNLTTSGNGYGGIEVAKGNQVIGEPLLTIVGALNIADDPKIWIDINGSNKNADFADFIEVNYDGLDFTIDNSGEIVMHYTVSFNPDNGGNVFTETVQYGDSVPEPAQDPTKTGYTFVDWFEAGATVPYDFTAPLTGNLELTAKWDANPHTVAYYNEDGNLIVVMNYHYNDIVTAPQGPAKTGYTFVGWFEDGATDAYDFTVPLTGDLELTAKYAINLYQVSFESNGGSTVADLHDVAYNTTISAPAVPTKTGYTFAGWFTDSAFANAYNFAAPVTGDFTLYAKWAINTYIVTFDAKGGSAVAAVPVAYNSAVTAPADPTRDGYTFEGWFTESTYANVYDFAAPVTGDFILYAKWTAIVPPYVWINPFTDVKSGAWYYDAVEFMNSNGYIKGTTTTKFSPNTDITRGMIITILYRIAGEPAASGNNPFADVRNGAYYTEAVKWGAANGLILGYGNGKFGPNDLITREQLAAILYRYEQFTGIAPADINQTKAFADASSISNYAKPAVDAMTRQGIIVGKTADTFAPKANATRAEAAMMLFRYLTY